MDNKKPLEGADSGMEYRNVGDDILYGFKSFRLESEDVAQFIFEIYYRDDEHPEPVYLREKVVGDPVSIKGDLPHTTKWIPRMVDVLIKVITDPEYRDETREALKGA